MSNIKELIESIFLTGMKKVYLFFTELLLSVGLLFFKKRMIYVKSYYPEYSNKAKNSITQTIEMLIDIWRGGV